MKKILVALLLVSTLFATLLVPAHAADPKLEAVYAEGAVDVDFDSAADYTCAAPGNSTSEVKDGVLKISSNVKTTDWNSMGPYKLVFDKVKMTVTDSTKSFGYSMRFRASNVGEAYLQFRSNMMSTNGNEIGQLSVDNGVFGVTKCSGSAGVNSANNQKAVDAELTNLKDGNWHVVDVVFTPTAENKNVCDLVVVIDGIEIYNSADYEDKNAELGGNLAKAVFSGEISTMDITFGTRNYDPAETVWTLELDYFRAGNVELQEVIEDNGDTSDMTVSVVVAAVALVATTTVVLRKKSR